MKAAQTADGDVWEEIQSRVFVSYNWTSEEHQERIKGWGDRLIADGIDVVFDVYDLKEGSDKYGYMERMVTDRSVTHAQIVSWSGWQFASTYRNPNVPVRRALDPP